MEIVYVPPEPPDGGQAGSTHLRRLIAWREQGDSCFHPTARRSADPYCFEKMPCGSFCKRGLSMRTRPLITTGVVGMFAGEWLFIHPNLASHQYNPWFAMFLWTVFGAGAAFLGDRTYNQWQMRTNNEAVRALMLWVINALIFLAAYLLSRLAFALAS